MRKMRTCRIFAIVPATLHLSSAYYFANTCVHPPQRQNAAIDRRCNPYFILTEGRPDLALANMADSGAPPTRSDAAAVADVDMPKVLPSEKGIDYIPLATMLATGQLAEADQFTRDALVELAGSKAKGRNFVYFTEVKQIPAADLATIERLWNRFSGGKFGYSVQKRKWMLAKGDFESFCRKVGWTTKDGDLERKKRWFGASEFIYNVKKAPEGHLPLTSALRGTSLLKQILNHSVWEDDIWKNEPKS